MNRYTQLVHYEHTPNGSIRPNSTPIYQTATFACESATQCSEYDYSRSANPTRSVLEQQIAHLECAKHSLIFASGVAAISTVLELLNPNEHIIVSDDLYGGTYRLLAHYEKSKGIKVSWIDTTNLESVEQAFNQYTKLVFIETPSNPLHKISNIRKIAELTHQNNALLVVDNTFLSPWLQQPLLLGADIVVHSATKFLSGHSDLTAGCVAILNDAIYEKLKYIQNAFGNALAPFESWLLLRSLKTLGLRVERQQNTAQIIAAFLESYPAIKQVYYAGLASHSGYLLNQSQANGAGSVICFTTGSSKLSQTIVNNAKLFTIAVSFGSVNSCISLPFHMSHASIPSDKNNCPRDLIRLSIGIEDSQDLINDLTQAINLSLNLTHN